MAIETEVPAPIVIPHCQTCGRPLPNEAAVLPVDERLCPQCSDPRKSPPRFDFHQFEKPRRSKKFRRELAAHVGHSDITGFQELPPSVPRHGAPEWVYNRAFVLKLCGERARSVAEAGRRVRALYLYFRLGWKAREIAGYFRTPENPVTAEAIEAVLSRLVARAGQAWPSFKNGTAPGQQTNAARMIRRSASRTAPAKESPRLAIRASTITAAVIEGFLDGDSEARAMVEGWRLLDVRRDPLARLSDRPEPSGRDRVGQSVITFFGACETSRGRDKEPPPVLEFSGRTRKEWRGILSRAGFGLPGHRDHGPRPSAEVA